MAAATPAGCRCCIRRLPKLPYAETVQEMVKHASYTPFTKAGAAIDTACATALSPMWLGHQTAATATAAPLPLSSRRWPAHSASMGSVVKACQPAVSARRPRRAKARHQGAARGLTARSREAFTGYLLSARGSSGCGFLYRPDDCVAVLLFHQLSDHRLSQLERAREITGACRPTASSSLPSK